MKIENCSPYCNRNTYEPKKVDSTNFCGALDVAGLMTQKIQDGGFLVSFLIQDCLGMTLPRTGAAFLRDKEVTGRYNMQEGFEVLGREGLTGPIMMAIAPIMLALAAKFGRTTSVNSQLIRRFGNSLKELISKPGFNKSLLSSKDKFQHEFLKTNIKEILTNTVGKENVKEESIEYILKQISNYRDIPKDAVLKKFRGKAKYRSQCIENIIKHINNIKYTSATNLEMLDKVNVGSKSLNNIKAFSTKDTIDAMIKYSDDAIALNKNLEKLDELAAESIKNKSIGKRILTTVVTLATTLGVMSILPKLYAKSNISPGARTVMILQEQEKLNNSENSTNNDENISFKGKTPNSKSILEKLGEFYTKHIKENLASELEYNGHNFTNTLMAGLSIFGLIFPRGKRAIDRAQTDPVTKKKDYTELYEILIRDVTSSLGVVFAVPILTKAAVSLYENRSGFVLMHRDRSKSGFKAFLDAINPYSSRTVLSNKALDSLYNNVDTKEKMLNFCQYIDNNGGDLHKILSKSNMLNDDLKNKLQEVSKKSVKEKNTEIKSFFENMKSGETTNQIIAKIMKNSKNPGKNKIFSLARALNSAPALIATLFISPFILGWIIPRLTYANTRRIHEKQAQERAAIENAKVNASV